MPDLTPDQYTRLRMPDLVAMTQDRIADLEGRHYAVLLDIVEQEGHRSAEQVDALDDLERRIAIHRGRLMPADAHDEKPPAPREDDGGGDGDGDGDGSESPGEPDGEKAE